MSFIVQTAKNPHASHQHSQEPVLGMIESIVMFVSVHQMKAMKLCVEESYF